MSGPLAGIRIIDLTTVILGPYATQRLGDLGADVIKVESRDGDNIRHSAPMKHHGMGHIFLHLNRNKRSLVLDLKQPAGHAAMLKLCATADVLIYNVRPQAMRRLGLDYPALQAINPRLIYVAVSGFGHRDVKPSPYSDHPAFDIVAQALSGLMQRPERTEDRPVYLGFSLSDIEAGIVAAQGTLLALLQRAQTGRGQKVEVAMQDAMVNYCRIAYSRQLMTNKACERNGNSVVLGNAPCEVFKCKPGGHNDYVFIYTSRATNAHWENLCDTIGRADLKADPRLATPVMRGNHAKEINAEIEKWTMNFTKHEAMEKLGAAGVPCGAVMDTKELSDDPTMVDREIFVDVDHPVRGKVRIPGWPVKMSDSHVAVKASPILGANTYEVYGEMLGLSKADVDALKKEKVV